MLTTRACGCKSLNFHNQSDLTFHHAADDFFPDARLASQTVQSCILAGYVVQLNDPNWASCFFEGGIAVYAHDIAICCCLTVTFMLQLCAKKDRWLSTMMLVVPGMLGRRVLFLFDFG